MTEIELGEDGVLRWSAPVPPNGVILHYNVIITRADTGDLIIRIEQLEILSIDLHMYGEIGQEYIVRVRFYSINQCIGISV